MQDFDFYLNLIKFYPIFFNQFTEFFPKSNLPKKFTKGIGCLDS